MTSQPSPSTESYVVEIGAGKPTHMQFVGATIYCSVKGGRLRLDDDHRYGRSFTCPYCHAFVSGRLEAGGTCS